MDGRLDMAFKEIANRCNIPTSAQARKNRRPRAYDRRTVNVILMTGCVWADIPKEYGSKSTAHRRFQDWWEMGVSQKMLRAAIKQATQDQTYNRTVDSSLIPAKKGHRRRIHRIPQYYRHKNPYCV